MIKKALLMVMGALGMFLTFTSEGAYDSTFKVGGEDRPSITMSHNSWDDGIGTTAVVANVLRDEGFEVNLVQLDPAILFSSISTGDSDVSVVPWSISHSPYMEEFGENIDLIGAHAEGAANGAVVPAYMEDINHIEDLTDEANQIFTSIEPGAVIVNQAQDAIDTYDNLTDWEVRPASTGAMLTQLRQAYENEEEIVITGWTPHWKFLEFDLKMLEDPAETFEAGENLLKIANKDFSEGNPIAYQILENFSWSIDDVQQVMTYLQEDLAPEQAARKWMDENPDTVAEWTEGIER